MPKESCMVKLHGKMPTPFLFEKRTKVPPKVAIDDKAVLPLENIEKPELIPWKSLRFKDEERAEA